MGRHGEVRGVGGGDMGWIRVGSGDIRLGLWGRGDYYAYSESGGKILKI
jgi:hypothetical protein